MSEQGPKGMVYDPELRGTWVAAMGHEAIPWDIGGMNEDGTFRPGTMFLEDGPPLIETGISPCNPALGGLTEVVTRRENASE